MYVGKAGVGERYRCFGKVESCIGEHGEWFWLGRGGYSQIIEGFLIVSCFVL